MVSRGCPIVGLTRERGQASLLLLGVFAALLAGTLILFGFGQALGAKSKHQRAVDLAAVSAAQVMRRHYPRLFEPPFLEPGVPNPRHLEQATYVALARAAAVRGAGRNGVRIRPSDVSFPAEGFAPTRVMVRARGHARVRVGHQRPAQVPVRASATAELSPGPGAGMPTTASGGGYGGALAYRQGKPMHHLFSTATACRGERHADPRAWMTRTQERPREPVGGLERLARPALGPDADGREHPSATGSSSPGARPGTYVLATRASRPSSANVRAAGAIRSAPTRVVTQWAATSLRIGGLGSRSIGRRRCPARGRSHVQ
jgi:hypothetical protein